MTPKEAPFGTPMEELRFLQKLETVGNAFWLRFEYIAKALNELEELKRDVKRYFELDERYFALPDDDGFQPECNELYKLKVKLSKVGNEK